MKKLISKALLALPPHPVLDRAHSLPSFWVAHGRFPRRDSGLFSDYLYFLKTRYHEDPAIHLRRYITDKENAKTYARRVLGRDLAPRTLHLFESPSDVRVGMQLGDSVIKPTHLSGEVIYHRAGPLVDAEASKIRSWFDRNLYRDVQRVPNYRGVRGRAVAEEMVSSSEDIKDYKFLCYRGEPRIIQVDVARHVAHKRGLYTADWRRLRFWFAKPLADPEPPPDGLDEMLESARRLSRDFEFLRVDFYQTPGRVWFGEFANYPGAAHDRFESLAAEMEFSRIMFEQTGERECSTPTRGG